MKIIVTDIKYDTDGLKDDYLPREIELKLDNFCSAENFKEAENYITDYIADQISDITGYCVCNFSYMIV